jgi:L-alanine-DL-glutamate epimerase-like enolase superfamily enzyme
MRLQSVEAFPIRLKVGGNLRGGSFTYTHYQAVLVRVSIDGVEGWGEAMTRFDTDATALMVRYLAKGLVGMEFEDVGRPWAISWKELRVRGHTRGTDVEALSGIEIALYDAVGRIMRKPLGSLFSGRLAKTVPVYAGSLFSSRGPLEEQAEEAISKGLSGAKVKIGFGASEDRRMLGSVRRKWPDGMLIGDANGAYDARGAAKACEAFADLGLAWFEEPVLSDDIEGYARLKGSPVRIGAGESWFVDDFRQPIDQKLVGVIEPSVSRCGGIGVQIGVARKAAKMGILFSPMVGMNSVISLAASIHSASVCQSVGVEYNPYPNPLQTELGGGLGKPSRGKMEVPRGSGLGITIDRRFVKAHTM